MWGPLLGGVDGNVLRDAESNAVGFPGSAVGRSLGRLNRSRPLTWNGRRAITGAADGNAVGFRGSTLGQSLGGCVRIETLPGATERNAVGFPGSTLGRELGCIEGLSDTLLGLKMELHLATQ